MRTLATLIRVHQYKLDEKRRELADFERLRADLTTRRDRLEAELAAEQAAAKTVECGAFAYGGFALGVISRREKLAASLAEIDVRIEAAREEVAAAFQELKRYEIVLAARQKKLRAELDRKEQMRLDEVSLDMHRRRSA